MALFPNPPTYLLLLRYIRDISQQTQEIFGYTQVHSGLMWVNTEETLDLLDLLDLQDKQDYKDLMDPKEY
jgi:hypothetical protein